MENYDPIREADITGCSFVPAYPYLNLGLTDREKCSFTNLTSSRKAYKVDNSAKPRPYRARSAIGVVGSLGPSQPKCRFLSHGSQSRHIIWSQGFGFPNIILLGDIGTDPVAKDMLDGGTPINALMPTYMPMRDDCCIIVVYSEGFTMRGNPRKFEQVRGFQEFDGSGQYFLGAVIATAEHGSWEEGDESGYFIMQPRCRRYVAYRDCTFNYGGGLVLGSVVSGMRPGPEGNPVPDEYFPGQPTPPSGHPVPSQNIQYEPFNFYHTPLRTGLHTIPFLSTWLPSDNYAQSSPSIYAPKMAQGRVIDESSSSNNLNEYGVTQEPDFEARAIPYLEFIEGTGGANGNHFDLLVYAEVFRWVKMVRVIKTLSGGFKVVDKVVEAQQGYLATTGRIWYCF